MVSVFFLGVCLVFYCCRYFLLLPMLDLDPGEPSKYDMLLSEIAPYSRNCLMRNSSRSKQRGPFYNN